VQFPASFVSVRDAPRARFEGYNISIGGKLWCVGGFDANFHVVPGADVFDPSTNRWTSLPNFRLKCAETHAGVAVDGRFVYFAGGYVGDLLKGRQQPITSSVWRWEPGTNNWKRVAELPEGRGGGALVKLKRELHYFGGCLADRVTNSGTHWMLSLGATSGAADDGKQWIQRRSLPKARDHLSGAALNGKIYAIGGEFGHDVLSDQKSYVHCYNPKTNRWTRVANLHISKSHAEAGTFVMAGRIFIAGGQVAGHGPTRDVEEYDPAKNIWTQVKPLPAPRQGAAIQPLGLKVIVTLGATQTEDPQTDAWLGQLTTV
jgi:N-acetylneuraminic acid mutarotase